MLNTRKTAVALTTILPHKLYKYIEEFIHYWLSGKITINTKWFSANCSPIAQLVISISVVNHDISKKSCKLTSKNFLLDNQKHFVLPWHHIWNSSFLLVLLVAICQYLQRLHQEHTGHRQCEPIYKEKRYDFAIRPSEKMPTGK